MSGKKVLGKLKTNWPALGVIVLLASGCAFIGMVVGQKKIVSTFNHAVHAEEEMECVDCHEGAEEEASAGLPEFDFCLDCHEDDDNPAYVKWAASAPKEDGKVVISPRKRKAFADVIAPHGAHHKAKVSCTTCHGEIGSSISISDKFPADKALCMGCHNKKKPLDCTGCHKTIRKDKKPDSHNAGWERFHGTEVDTQFELQDNRCYLCHSQSTCKKCHQAEPPRSHTANWRTRSHGLYAETERDSCLVCHSQDYCARCHKAAPPFPRITDHTTGADCSTCHRTVDHGLRFTESFECRKCHK